MTVAVEFYYRRDGAAADIDLEIAVGVGATVDVDLLPQVISADGAGVTVVSECECNPFGIVR